MNNAEVLIKFKASGTEDVEKKSKNVANTLKKTGQDLAIVSVAAGGAIAGIAKVGTEFEKSMSNVQAISGATADDMKLLENKAREMGKQTIFSASESADALSYMALAGWKTKDMLEGLPGILNLASAGNTDLATTSDIVTDALTAFGKTAEDSTKLADIMAATMANSNTNIEMLGNSFKYIASLAGAMNYTMEDTSLALGLMANSGIKADQAGTSLRMMFTRLASPPDTCATAMEKLGISLTDSTGKMKPMRDVIQDLRKAFSGLNEEQKAEYASAIAGKNALSGMLALVNSTDEDFNKLAGAIDNSSGSAQQMADIMNQSTSNQLKIMWSEVQELGLQLAESLLPVVKGLIGAMTSVAQWLQTLNPGVKNTILVVLGLVAGLTPVLLLVAKIITAIQVVIPIITAVGGAIGFLMNPITLIIGGIGLLIGAFAWLWNHCEAFRNFWINIWENIKMKFAVTVESVKAFFRGLINFFTGIPGELKEIGSNMIKGLIDGVNGMKDKAVGAVKNVGKNLLNGMKNVLGIHSPSKEFGIIGKFSVLGYTEALDNMSGEVDKAINSTFGLSPNLTNSASLHYSPNVVVNNNVDISQDPLGQMVSNIKSFSGGAKNDYSFGLGE